MAKISSKANAKKGSTAAHQNVVKQVLLTLSKLPYCRVWSNNTGVGRDLSSERIIRFGLKGSSDIIGIYKGLFLAVEVKTGGAVQTQDQKRFQKMIDTMGGIYVVCRETNVKQIETRIEDVFNATKK